MKKLIAATAAAGLLVTGAFVASTITSGAAEAQTTDTTQTTDATRERSPRLTRGDILNDVLDGLVSDGTIDSDQAVAITDAFAAKRAELGEKFGERRPGSRLVTRGELRGLLADGVITAEEIANLPEDHPLRTGLSPLSALLDDDGQITREELEAFRAENRPDGRGLGG